MSRNEWAATNLGAQASLCSKKDKSKNVSADSYVSTANMAPDFGGLSGAGVLPEGGTVTLFECGDVLFSNIRTYFRKVWKADFSGGCSNDVLVFRTKDPNHLDQGYLYHLLRWKKFTDLTVRTSKGAKMPRGDKTSMLNFEFDLPPLPEQRAIAHILGTLDDKIELNRQMSENLEEMAAALFKAWFVDFEPVKAKMEGRWKKGESLPGMPAKLYDLFPDKLVETEEGEFIPEGWEKATIMECFDVTMGQSPPGNTYNSINDGTPFYQGSTDFGFRFPSRRIYCTKPTRIARKWETLMSVRAPVGDINQAFEECAIGRGVCSVIHKEGYSSYTHYFVKNMRNIFNSYNGEGTVFGSINKNTIGTIPFSSPPKGLVLAFEEYANPIDRKIGSLFFQDSPLRSMRDVLLPKLISGELRVPDVEKLVKQSEELEARKKEIADQFKVQP